MRRYLLLGLFEAFAFCVSGTCCDGQGGEVNHRDKTCALTFASLRDVAFGEFGAFAEEKLFHLLFHDFL
jgi:hypothetical protein